MKFSKGKINNINKKILAGALAMTLVMVPMSGCALEEYVKFEYSVSEDGEYESSGKVDYELLKKYEFIVIENKTYETQEFYICEYVPTYIGRVNVKLLSDQSYINVFNNKTVFKVDTDQRKMIYSETLENYLYSTDNIKKYYTVEDVELIFEGMKENYLKENNKQLVKEK